MLRSLRTRVAKPLYLLYYRSLYGRGFPMERRIRGWIERFENETGRGDVPVTQTVWDEQYRRGDWGFLHGSDEVARYSVISGLIHHARPGGSVLDIGGGEGILRRYLLRGDTGDYLGVDLSSAAIETARETADPGASFAVADAETFEPPHGFDAVVFNECVYYFHEPVDGVLRYLDHLAPGGLLVVSMFRSLRTQAIGRQLRERLDVFEELELSGSKGAWIISCFRAPKT